MWPSDRLLIAVEAKMMSKLNSCVDQSQQFLNLRFPKLKQSWATVSAIPKTKFTNAHSMAEDY